VRSLFARFVGPRALAYTARTHTVMTRSKKPTMNRKIFRAGNSMVISLPKEMLDALHVGEGEEVSVELDPARSQIVISPAPAAVEGVDAEFARQVADFIEQYRPALEALAR
jgi:putative addiction module antidote